MVDRENLLPVHPNLHKCFIFLGKPESINFLILAHEVGPFNPKRKFPRRMAGNPDDGEVLTINPYLAFKQILVWAFWHRPHNETAIRPHLLFPKKLKGVIRRGDGAIVVLPSRGGFNLTRDQWVECQAAHEPRT